VNKRPFRQNREQASALLISLMAAGIIGTTVAGFVVLTQAHDASVFRSQSWNSVIPGTEAGIEEGMEFINKYAGTGSSATTWTNSAGADGWAALPGNIYYRRRYFGSNYCDIYVTNQSNQPSIQSVGTVRTGSPFVGTGTGDAQRAVVVTTTPIVGPYFGAILTKQQITLRGGVIIDSFNSQDPAYSTNGGYDPSKSKDGGDIATILAGATPAITGSNLSKMFGHVATGPNSTVSIGTAQWGSKAWVTNTLNNGVQPGWFRSDMNVAVPDAPPAGFSGVTFSKLTTPITIAGTNYDYYLAPGNYQVSSLAIQGTNAMYVDGAVNLRVTGNFTMGNLAYIYIPPASTLSCWVGGTANLAGGGIINGTGYATNCSFYGETTCNNFTISGDSPFIGTVYAPEAAFRLTGGSTSQLFLGAIIANSAWISGGYSFHYDESLAYCFGGGYYVASWKELAADALSP
jgi:uncharacterized membrane protein YeaQ/YmgE (transglycosylase-associated protein family)